MRFVLSTTSDEYKSLVSNFDQAMKGEYTQIIQIERIQNERSYMQYVAHNKDFKKRLNMDTETRLYHGCPEQASNSIINGYFNRSFAGVNGKPNLHFFTSFRVVCTSIYRNLVWCRGLFFIERSL